MKPDQSRQKQPLAAQNCTTTDLAAQAHSVAPLAASEDRFLGDKVRTLQPQHGYRAGIDAVLLAAAAPIEATGPQQVLDAGAGVGVVGLCLAARYDNVTITMLEQSPELALLAQQNAAGNGWQDRISIIEGDLTKPAASLVSAGLELESYDHVLANPPYFTEGAGTPAKHHLKARANAMEPGALEHWARFLAAAAKPGGTLSLIHRADALAELLSVFGHRFGAITILPVYSRAGKAAKRIILQGVKGSRAPLTLLPGFILHRTAKDGSRTEFTPEAEAILRQGLSLQEALAAPDNIL